MSKYSLHRCRLYNPSTNAVNSISYEKKLKKLAVSRSDGSLEIWDTRDNICRELVFPPIPNSSIESIVWCKRRLFTTGFDGFLREYSLQKIFPVSELKISASAVWCLTKNSTETHLAVGTEDGAVSLLFVDDNNKARFEKTLAHIEKRIICLAWHDDGNTLAGGSADSIRIWNVESGRCFSRISVPRRIASVEILIWSLCFDNGTVLVSGDSEGRTSFWNYPNGTLINTFESHKADVLCVISDKINNRFYSSGIDPAICQFVPIEEKIDLSSDYGEAKRAKRLNVGEKLTFVEGTRRNIHTHDVRSLDIMDDWLISGGIDTFINLSKYPPNAVRRVPPFDANRVQFAALGGFVAFQHEHQTEIWSLGRSDEPVGDENGQLLKLNRKPLKIAEIKSKENEWILCSALNDDGDYYANSDGRRTNLYNILIKSENSKPEVLVNRTKCLNGSLPGGSSLCFVSRPENRLIVATSESFFVLSVADGFCKLDEEIKFSNDFFVRKMSACLTSSRLIAVVTTKNEIFILNVEQKKIIATLPDVDFLPVDVRFSNLDDDLLVLYSDGSLLEYSTKLCEFTPFSRRRLNGSKLRLPWTSTPIGISLSYQNFDEIFVYGASQLFLLKKTEEKKSATSWIENKTFKWLCRFYSLHNGDVVVVEIDNENYLKRLPPTLNVRKFGAG